MIPHKKNTTTIGILDPSPIFRTGIKTAFQNIPHYKITYETASAEEYLQYITNCFLQKLPTPQILLLNPFLPDMHGYTLITRFYEIAYIPTIIAISASDHLDDILLMCNKGGCQMYLSQNLPIEELTSAIINYHEKSAYASCLYHLRKQKITLHERTKKKIILSNTQLHLLGLLCKPLEQAEIAAQVSRSVSSITAQSSELYRIFGVKNRALLILAAIKTGWVREANGELLVIPYPEKREDIHPFLLAYNSYTNAKRGKIKY